MTGAARWHEFAYEQTEIPAGITIREWRTQRARVAWISFAIVLSTAADVLLPVYAGKLVDAVAPGREFDLVWQSRSGPPSVPWLEPDVNDHLRTLAASGETAVVLFPIGFVSDHLEVIWDLDNEAKETAQELGLAFARAATAGTHPAFVESLRMLLEERHAGGLPRLGTNCPASCCFVPPRPSRG